MTVVIPRSKGSLAGLDPDRLRQGQRRLRHLLSSIGEYSPVDQGRRPHIAMRERRSEGRRRVQLAGACWDASSEQPKDAAKQPVQVIDISSGGCRFLSSAPMSPGWLLGLEVSEVPGERRPFFVEVTRVSERSDSERPSFEIRCRTVGEEDVSRERREIDLLRSVCARFESPSRIRIVQVGLGKGAETTFRNLSQEGYVVRKLRSEHRIAQEIAHGETNAVVFPVSVLADGDPPWLAQVVERFPDTALLALATAGERGFGALVCAPEIDMTLRAPATATDLRLAVECALCARGLRRAPESLESPAPKVLITGSPEQRLRRFETLLVEEGYLVAKCLDRRAVAREARREDFRVLIVCDSHAQGSILRGIEPLRTERADLIVIAETGGEEKARKAVEAGADLLLAASASRKELVESLSRACRLHQARLFVR
ncbi:MAG TPA: hypothetical protein VM492_13665 [Sumerlaeia bacterium]|nr:hypothetical protein [Sumerlaeia bacterium]